jgi:hypothetical protein
MQEGNSEQQECNNSTAKTSSISHLLVKIVGCNLQQNKQHLPCNFPMKNVSPDE